MIRHSKDYGVVVLLDNRLAFNRNQPRISQWVQKYLVVHDHGQDVIPQLDNFFSQEMAEVRKREYETNNHKSPDLKISIEETSTGFILNDLVFLSEELSKLRKSLNFDDEFKECLQILEIMDEKNIGNDTLNSTNIVPFNSHDEKGESKVMISYSYDSICDICKINKLKGS